MPAKNGIIRHPSEFRTFVLRKGYPSLGLYRPDTLCAVRRRSGKDHGNSMVLIDRSKAQKKMVDGMGYAICLFTRRQRQFAVDNAHISIGRDHIYPIRLNLHAIGDLVDWHSRLP